MLGCWGLLPKCTAEAYAQAAADGARASQEMGRGVMLLPPGIWLVRAPVMVAAQRFEVKTDANQQGNFVQTLDIPGTSAKPRLMYTPYNHSAMFIDGDQVE